MKLTEWFPAKIKPINIGPYETRKNKKSRIFYQYWNGEYWCFYMNNPETAIKYRYSKSEIQNPQWRGIAK